MVNVQASRLISLEQCLWILGELSGLLLCSFAFCSAKGHTQGLVHSSECFALVLPSSSKVQVQHLSNETNDLCESEHMSKGLHQNHP